MRTHCGAAGDVDAQGRDGVFERHDTRTNLDIRVGGLCSHLVEHGLFCDDLFACDMLGEICSGVLLHHEHKEIVFLESKSVLYRFKG